MIAVCCSDVYDYENNATHYVKLGNNNRQGSFERNYNIISLKEIIKAIIIIFISC